MSLGNEMFGSALPEGLMKAGTLKEDLLMYGKRRVGSVLNFWELIRITAYPT